MLGGTGASSRRRGAGAIARGRHGTTASLANATCPLLGALESLNAVNHETLAAERNKSTETEMCLKLDIYEKVRHVARRKAAR